MAIDDDDDFLPAEDRCGSRYCQLPEAAHAVRWADGGPNHKYVPRPRLPKPERYVGAHIQTDWNCSHCGAACDVWGEASEWMECGTCGKYSFLVPFASDADLPSGSQTEGADT